MDWLEVSLVVRWLLGWALALRLPDLPAGTPTRRQAVTVLIPARNEERTLPHLLAALARQQLQPEEVLVIDDHSSDSTAALVQRFAATSALPIRVVQPPPLPDGWCGKTWALHHGVQATTTELLVFLDADTAPKGLTSSSRCSSIWSA